MFFLDGGDTCLWFRWMAWIVWRWSRQWSLPRNTLWKMVLWWVPFILVQPYQSYRCSLDRLGFLICWKLRKRWQLWCFKQDVLFSFLLWEVFLAWRFWRWTHTGTMVTLCPIQAARTELVTRSSVFARYRLCETILVNVHACCAESYDFEWCTLNADACCVVVQSLGYFLTLHCWCIQERDPIERIRKLLLSREIATVAELKVRI